MPRSWLSFHPRHTRCTRIKRLIGLPPIPGCNGVKIFRPETLLGVSHVFLEPVAVVYCLRLSPYRVEFISILSLISCISGSATTAVLLRLLESDAWLLSLRCPLLSGRLKIVVILQRTLRLYTICDHRSRNRSLSPPGHDRGFVRPSRAMHSIGWSALPIDL
ncbi:hypothetical protein B0J12DRAFT_665647 [Macrophomina phaseolina]|uniref:Uncharacterized protein n=1 Tax=Macrophomina phaseolina TaxID=35725 RepID=A0ABQ8G8L9_9PEZI|nr:hypothetical protein B0J12DRAFT_665647 [Macrophomina phaseolina]